MKCLFPNFGGIPMKDANEIIKNGICIQEKELHERCAKCNMPLIIAVYKYDGRKLKKIVRCKNCQTASRIL